MKIVSLLPAATEIVSELGLLDQLVGRSHECDFPDGVTDLPVLTRARIDASRPSAEIDQRVRKVMQQRLPIYMLDEARLTALAPDVVVTQAACEVCAISYDQVKTALGRTAPNATLVSLQPARLSDILDEIVLVANACGAAARGAALVQRLQARLSAVAARTPSPRPRVAVVEWLAPLMLAGHWVPEAIERAGAAYVGPKPGLPSPYASWEELASLRPEAIVVAPCGFDLARTLEESKPVLDRLRAITDRVLFLDGNAYLNRPGPRIVEAIETISGWLRGEALPAERGVSGFDATGIHAAA